MIPKPTRRGIMLVEMIVVISILGIAILMEARVFQGTMRAIQSSSAGENQITRIERLSATLRKDVWGASTIELPDSRTIVLRRAGGTDIRWQLSDGPVVRSTGPQAQASQQSWDVSLPLHARKEGPMIVVYTAGQKGGQENEIRFISQLMLAGGSQ